MPFHAESKSPNASFAAFGLFFCSASTVRTSVGLTALMLATSKRSAATAPRASNDNVTMANSVFFIARSLLSVPAEVTFDNGQKQMRDGVGLRISAERHRPAGAGEHKPVVCRGEHALLPAAIGQLDGQAVAGDGHVPRAERPDHVRAGILGEQRGRNFFHVPFVVRDLS